LQKIEFEEERVEEEIMKEKVPVPSNLAKSFRLFLDELSLSS